MRRLTVAVLAGLASVWLAGTAMAGSFAEVPLPRKAEKTSVVSKGVAPAPVRKAPRSAPAVSGNSVSTPAALKPESSRTSPKLKKGHNGVRLAVPVKPAPPAPAPAPAPEPKAAAAPLRQSVAEPVTTVTRPAPQVVKPAVETKAVETASEPQKLPPPAVPQPKSAVRPAADDPLRGTLPEREQPATPGVADEPLRGALSSARRDQITPDGTDPTATGSLSPLRGAIAAQQTVEGLIGAVESALNSSISLRASLADEQGAKYGIWREMAAFTPTITGTLEQNWTGGNGNRSDGEMAFGGLQMTMPIFTSGQRLFSVQAAGSIARAAHFRTASVRDGVVLQMAEAYMQQIYAVRALDALGRNETMMQRLLSSIQAQHRAGFASGADVAEVSAELDAVRQQIAELNVMRRKARDKANSLAGRQVAVRLVFPKLDAALAIGQHALRASAMRRNPNVLVAQNNAEASKHSSRAAVSRYLPQVGLNASYRQVLGDITDGGDRDRWSVGVKMTVPLVDLTTVASIGESRQRAAADRYRAQDAGRQIGEQLDALWSERDGILEREKLARSRVANLRKVAEAGDAKFRKGLIGLDSLLDSQRRLVSTEVEAAQLDVQAALTDVQILITAGTFSPRLLAE